jgi:putative FmdB family regulatory protein
MPLYEYQAVENGCPKCAGGWEELQDLQAAPLERCPRCGAAVRRLPSRFSAGRSQPLSDGNLREHGFQKFTRDGEGDYRREV